MRIFYIVILMIMLAGFIGSLLRAVEHIVNAAVRGEKAEYTAEIAAAVFSALIGVFMIFNILPI